MPTTQRSRASNRAMTSGSTGLAPQELDEDGVLAQPIKNRQHDLGPVRAVREDHGAGTVDEVDVANRKHALVVAGVHQIGRLAEFEHLPSKAESRFVGAPLSLGR